MTIILSIGKPVWSVIIDRQETQFRIVFAWFSVILLNYDLDSEIGKLK